MKNISWENSRKKNHWQNYWEKNPGEFQENLVKLPNEFLEEFLQKFGKILRESLKEFQSILVYIAKAIPVWEVPEDFIERIVANSPEGIHTSGEIT